MTDVGSARDELLSAAMAWVEYRYAYTIVSHASHISEADETLMRAGEAFYSARAQSRREEVGEREKAVATEAERDRDTTDD